MKKLLETLYILTPDSYVYHRNENICVSIGGAEKACIPITQIHSIVFFGKNTASTSLFGFCGDHDVTVSFLDLFGHFEGRLCGKVSGNVLLRKRQYDSLNQQDVMQQTVRSILYAKLLNGKILMMRYARNSETKENKLALSQAAAALASCATELEQCTNIDGMRGVEGAAASIYFAQFDRMLGDNIEFTFKERSRRPPKNEVNAVLSFLYTQLTHDVVAALETVGLDPAVGYLHTLRPGRPSFALDLMEEFRAPLCDRLTITLFNRKQLASKHFEAQGEGIYLNEKGRREVLSAWRARKLDEISHPFLNEKIPIGLIPYTQAMLFARMLRGDLDQYPPFVWR